MPIAQYKIDPNGKTSFKNIAETYNVSVYTLATCNNCYNRIPIYVQDVPRFVKQGYINVPIPNNGGKDLGDGWYISRYNQIDYTRESSLLQGSGGDVTLIINGQVLAMPCYPTSLTDSVQSDYSSQTVPYRTEPYLNYSNSGPRTVSVSFNLHREMKNETLERLAGKSDIDIIINTIQAAAYPTTGNSNAIRAVLTVGKHLHIDGIINGGITTSFSGPIIDGKYNVCDISFSITEVFGKMIYFNDKLSYGSNMNYT